MYFGAVCAFDGDAMTGNSKMQLKTLKELKDDDDAFLEGMVMHEKLGYYFHASVIEARCQAAIEAVKNVNYGSYECDAVIPEIIKIINDNFGVKE